MAKYLFVISVDEYKDDLYPNLHNAKLDAQRFSNVLTEKFGYELVTDILTDKFATRRGIIEGLNQLSSSILEDDDLIIFFAGHGQKHSVTNKGFWIPSDATESISDLIPNSTVIDTIEGINAKHILLISDSCFSGTFLTQTRSVTSESFHKLQSMKSRLLFTSGREEKVSDGEPGVGSPFAVSICDYLEKQTEPILASELFNHVIKYTANNSKQQAISSHIEKCGHEGGMLVFSPQDGLKSEKEKNDLEKLTTSIETAMKLKEVGIEQTGMFSFFENKKNYIVAPSSSSGKKICSAFMSQELHELIPDMIKIDTNTYIAHASGYDKLTTKDLEDFDHAEVLIQKTMIKDTPYMSICRCNGRMVAFGITNDGKYRNLIRWGFNQAEAIGEMVIALQEENKLKN